MKRNNFYLKSTAVTKLYLIKEVDHFHMIRIKSNKIHRCANPPIKDMTKEPSLLLPAQIQIASALAQEAGLVQGWKQLEMLTLLAFTMMKSSN